MPWRTDARHPCSCPPALSRTPATPAPGPLLSWQIAVVGAGPAGLAFSTTAARRGHQTTLFEASAHIGGQFNLAKQVPGKEEFYETLRYFAHELAATGVDLRLSKRVDAEMLLGEGFDCAVLATGVTPRVLNIAGEDHPSVVSYVDVLTRAKPVGERVAVIGAGGIGFDVGEFLAHRADMLPPAPVENGAADPAVDALLGGGAASTPRTWPDHAAFMRQWGIDPENSSRGGLLRGGAAAPADGGAPHEGRKVYLLQRTRGKHGSGLGKTTGWIHRATLKQAGVEMIGGLEYVGVDDSGLHVLEGKEKTPRLLEVDTVVVCAGQLSEASLEQPLTNGGMRTFKIGGAHLAAELDAKRAIDQATRLAATIETASPDKVGELVAPLGAAGWLFQKLAKR